ncbi:hypothetical protein KW798_02820 [Candidatus Parcubacteria bacterium]|nr:hypothetical protein [Candidatus Parcubacteria bacterium]
MSQTATANFILRAGIAFVFLYPAINAYFEPYTWIGYFPPFTRGYVDEFLMLHAFGVVEIVIALWILSGWKVFYPALVAGVMLLAIVVTNTQDFPILFRDLGLAAAAFYLALANPPRLAYP